MIEVTLDAMGISATAPTDEELDQGQPAEINMTVIGGMYLPFAGPDKRPMQAPVMATRFTLDRETARKIGEALVNEANRLPSKPNIAVASDLSGVKQAVELDKRFRG